MLGFDEGPIKFTRSGLTYFNYWTVYLRKKLCIKCFTYLNYIKILLLKMVTARGLPLFALSAVLPARFPAS